MKISPHLILTLSFFACFIFSVLINFILLKFAQTLGIRNKDANQVRWNPKHKPSLGGISFYFIFLFAIIFSLLKPTGNLGLSLESAGLLIACTLAFLMGLADDAFNTQPLLKFITQIVCAIVIIVSGHSISIFQNQYLNYLLTIIWIVGIMNSINMLDNMDGITTVVSICVLLFGVAANISLFNTNSVSNILCICLLGALCGFLIFNFHPSKMFMGDTGSQFLGIFLGTLGINYCWNVTPCCPPVYNLHNIVIVCLVFLIPLTDTFTVIINRMRAGNSPFIGGKDHTTHHLFFKGITEKKIALLYFFIALIAIILAYQLVFNSTLLLLIISICYVLLVFAALFINTIYKKV